MAKRSNCGTRPQARNCVRCVPSQTGKCEMWHLIFPTGGWLAGTSMNKPIRSVGPFGISIPESDHYLLKCQHWVVLTPTTSILRVTAPAWQLALIRHYLFMT